MLTIEELKTAFDIISLRGKHHIVKNSDIHPLQIDNKQHSIAIGEKAASHNLELLVCNLCNLPQKIARPNTKADITPIFTDDKEQQQALHNVITFLIKLPLY